MDQAEDLLGYYSIWERNKQHHQHHHRKKPPLLPLPSQKSNSSGFIHFERQSRETGPHWGQMIPDKHASNMNDGFVCVFVGWGGFEAGQFVCVVVGWPASTGSASRVMYELGATSYLLRPSVSKHGGGWANAGRQRAVALSDSPGICVLITAKANIAGNLSSCLAEGQGGCEIMTVSSSGYCRYHWMRRWKGRGLEGGVNREGGGREVA